MLHFVKCKDGENFAALLWSCQRTILYMLKFLWHVIFADNGLTAKI